jgi:hypothetical protein
MKQVIFLSFYCQIYKKAPIARIYVGDTLIDEIEIPEYIDETFEKLLEENNGNWNMYYRNFGYDRNQLKFFKEKTHILDPRDQFSFRNSKFEDICKIKEEFKHPKFFLYFIDNEHLISSNGVIRIEIKNSDSNYNNGFMSKSTLLTLHSFYVIPEVWLDNPIERTQHHLDTYSRNTTVYSLTELKKFYKGTKTAWPLNLQKYFVLKNKETNQSNQFVYGGDCKLTIKLKKKYNLWWGETTKNIGFFKINAMFIKYLIIDLLNKYKENENQRNTD